MTITEILSDLYQRLGYTSAPASDVTTRLKRFVNQTHRMLLAEPSLQSLRDDTITFASVNGQTRYGLPPAVAAVQAITDRTNSVRLCLATQDALRTDDPGLIGSGTPDSYVLQGMQAVAIQPTSAAEIFIKSTSASDVGTAYLEGIRTGGYPVSLSVTMTGTTAVSFGAAYADILEITKLYLSTAAVGTVTCHMTSGLGAELARLAIGQAFSRYQSLQLWPTPSAAITYYVDYMRTIPDLVNGTDEPLLPQDFHWMLVEGALVTEWTVRDDNRAGAAARAYATGLSRLKYRVACPPDFLPTVGRASHERSRLGSSFPDGAGAF